jgi:hypothetical protein
MMIFIAVQLYSKSVHVISMVAAIPLSKPRLRGFLGLGGLYSFESKYLSKIAK